MHRHRKRPYKLSVSVNIERDNSKMDKVTMECIPHTRIDTTPGCMPTLMCIAARAATELHRSLATDSTLELSTRLAKLADESLSGAAVAFRSCGRVALTHGLSIRGHTVASDTTTISVGSLILDDSGREFDLQVPVLEVLLHPQDSKAGAKVAVIAIPTPHDELWMKTFVDRTDLSEAQPVLHNARVGCHVPRTMTFDDLQCITRDVHDTAVRSLFSVHADPKRNISTRYKYSAPFMIHQSHIIPTATTPSASNCSVTTILRAC